MAELLAAIAILFIIAGPFMLLADGFEVPPAPMLIISGILAGFFIDETLTRELAQFGIALLVFTFGVNIQLTTIETVLRDSELAAISQVAVVGSIGTAFGVILGLPVQEAIFIGVAAALSSTIVATALLQTEIRTNLVRGRLGQSIQFVQDILAIGFLLVLGAEAWALDPVVLQIGYGVLFLGGAILVNRFLFNLIGRFAGKSVELMIIGIISMLALFIAAADAVDIPIVIGAFAAGLAVKHDPARYLGLFNGIESIKDFFVAIFFATVGALVVLPFIEIGVTESLETLVLVAGLVVLTGLIKPIITVAMLIQRGYEARTATLTGLSTDQISEFALVIAIEALLLGMLSQQVFDAIILAAAITMITSSITHLYGEHIYRGLVKHIDIPGRHDKIDHLSEVPEGISDHVIILGYGEKGRQLLHKLEDVGHPCVIIENDPAQYEDVRFNCERYVFGDAMEPYTWELANAEEAIVIISVTSSEVVSRRLLSFDFGTNLILRAWNERTALEYLESGATYVVVPDLLAGEELTEHVRAVLSGEITQEDLQSIGKETLDVYPERTYQSDLD